MIEPALRRFLAYEKRKEAVIIGTILAGLVIVWPAADVYIAARQRTHDVQIQREEAEVEIAKLPQFTRMQELKAKELEVLTAQLVEGDAARRLRSFGSYVSQSASRNRVIVLVPNSTRGV